MIVINSARARHALVTAPRDSLRIEYSKRDKTDSEFCESHSCRDQQIVTLSDRSLFGSDGAVIPLVDIGSGDSWT